jgi:hypothetical protein
MSSADDVLEMKDVTNTLADYLVGKGALLKERVGAVLAAINEDAAEPISDNRALELLKGKARRVDAWEKEHATRRLEKLRDRARRERELAHLRWLESEIARHRATGSGIRGAHADGLEHFLRMARSEAGAVGVPAARDDRLRGEAE